METRNNNLTKTNKIIKLIIKITLMKDLKLLQFQKKRYLFILDKYEVF